MTGIRAQPKIEQDKLLNSTYKSVPKNQG